MVVRTGGIGVGGIGQFELSFLADMPDVRIVAGTEVSPGACAMFEDEDDAFPISRPRRLVRW